MPSPIERRRRRKQTEAIEHEVRQREKAILDAIRIPSGIDKMREREPVKPVAYPEYTIYLSHSAEPANDGGESPSRWFIVEPRDTPLPQVESLVKANRTVFRLDIKHDKIGPVLTYSGPVGANEA